MNRHEFFGMVKDKGIIDSRELRNIQLAYWLAKTVHREQKRDSGERYFEHCRRVALCGADAKEIIVGLLHDCIEDSFIPYEILLRCFGLIACDIEILSKTQPILDPLTGFAKNRLRKRDDKYYDRISDWSSTSKHVKIFDRLDNLRSMRGTWSKEKQLKYIAETEKYILPIAKKTDETVCQLLMEEIEKIRKKGGE